MPNTSTARIALVRGVMAASTRLLSMHNVSGSMSTNTGVARSKRMQFVDAMKLKGVVMTSSPGPISKARMRRWSALVPLLTATA
jgi:hypothetical protein